MRSCKVPDEKSDIKRMNMLISRCLFYRHITGHRMRMILFVVLFFVIDFNVFATDRVMAEAERIIRDFHRLEELLGQAVPSGFQRTGPDMSKRSYGTTMLCDIKSDFCGFKQKELSALCFV